MIVMQHLAATLFALAALGTAMAAAIYWFRSARVKVPELQELVSSISDAPEDHILAAIADANSVREAMNVSSRLNQKAAVWTGISALLGAAASIAAIIR